VRREINGKEIVLIRDDITESDADAIVNPANKDLILGAGVAGAIRKKGGPEIQEKCHKIGGTHVGGAVVTTGGKLRARYVIHAVGPRMGEGDEDNKLRNATLNSMKVADQKSLQSIVFPAISTGIFGFSKDRCANIMIRTVIDYLQSDTNLKQVVFCLYDDVTYKIFEDVLKTLMP